MSVHPNQKAKKARNSEKSEFLAFLYKNDLFSDLEGRFRQPFFNATTAALLLPEDSDA